MMIHIFTKFTDKPDDMPLGRALRAASIPNVLFGSYVRQTYRNRLDFLFGFLPRYAWDAVMSAVRSLIRAHPHPDVVVLTSDIEVLVFAALRLVLPYKPRIVLLGFIYTERGRPCLDALRRRYFDIVLRRAACIICHSRREVERNRALFTTPGRFVFVPWGTNVAIRDTLLQSPSMPADGAEYIVSAGRSGRDYATLARAMTGVPLPLRIICDYAPLVSALPNPDGRISILANCYGDDYVRALYHARVVVIPLKVDDISAGQMVLLSAMALGKPVVITRTATTTDYATDGVDALLVERGDSEAMRAAILRILEDPMLAARLGARAIAIFNRDYTTERFVANVLSVVTETVAHPAP
jgi:glycosyltransferase involved in cell wall biosynthesis